MLMVKQMKVLMITSTYEPIIGGTETLIKSLVSGLNNKGIDVDILTLNMDKMWKPKWETNIVDNGTFTIYRVSAVNPLIFDVLSNTLGSFFKMHIIPDLKFIDILKNYDLLHFHGEADMTFFLLSSQVKKPKLFQYHGIQALNRDNISYKIYKYNLLYKYLLKKEVCYHICNSRHAIKLLCELGIDKEKIKIIPNAIDLHRFSNITPINVSKYPQLFLNLRNETKKILCLGRLIPSKLDTIECTINAMPKIAQKISNLQLIIIGDGPLRKYVENISQKINQKLGNKSIILAGAIPSIDIPFIINLSDIVVGIGQVPVEAMACSKPVIVAGHMVGPWGGNFGGIITNENIEDLRDFNFSGRNSSILTTPDRIADAAIELLSDDQNIRSLGIFGNNYIQNKLDIKIVLNEIESIYEDCINQWRDNSWTD